MAPYEETKGVPKLTANNYSEWARRMRAVFRARKLWKFLYLHDPANTPSTTRRTARTTENQVPEDLPGPATPAAVVPTLPTPSYDQNTDIAELIDATLSTDIRQGIGRTTLDDGVRLWQLLEKKYSESGLRYYIKLARQLNALQWPVSENGDEYVGKRRQIQEEMLYTGIVPTPDLYDIVDLMEKLPPVRYGTILAILNAQDLATLTYDLAIKLVTDEEKRWRLEAERSSDSQSLALYANPNRGSNRSSNRDHRNRGLSQNQNQNRQNTRAENATPPHLRNPENRPQNRSNSRERQSSRFQRICEYCDRIGHSEERCWKKYPELQLKRPQERQRERRTKHKSEHHQERQNYHYTQDEDAPSTCSTFQADSRIRTDRAESLKNLAFTYDSYSTYLTQETEAQTRFHNSWIIDTGASNHLTFERELLYNYVKFPEPRRCGGISSSFYIEGQGSIDLKVIGDSTRTITLRTVDYSP